MQNGRRVIT
uniref:Uncharacterized protein n=1 Tax=Anguilla anguilla TaxID=7936 RepID=A0A0E9VZ21_ANGAN